MLSLFIVCLAVYSNAQTTATEKEYSISGGVDMAYAIGNFNSTHSLGYGLSAQGEYLFSDNASLTLNAGFMSFATKAVYDSLPMGVVRREQPAFTFVPLVIGCRVSYENTGYYLHPQVGIVFMKSRPVSATYTLSGGIQTSKHADFSLRYQAIINKGVIASFFALRAAYIF